MTEEVRRIRVAINGFGQIGRRTAAALMTCYGDYFDLVAINDLATPEDICLRLLRDSVYGAFPGAATIVDKNNLKVFTRSPGINNCIFNILLFAEKDPSDLPWRDLNIDLVIDATGIFTTREQLSAHLEAGARKVLLTAPTKDESIPMFVNGVNTETENLFDDEVNIASNASCTTNCIAPILKMIEEETEWGWFNTIHAITPSQKPFDSMGSKDPRRGRGCFHSLIPTTTGAAVAISKILPSLAGKLDGVATRYPSDTGSMVDLHVRLKDDMTLDDFKEALIARGDELQSQGIISVINDVQFVSCDVTGMYQACVVSLDLIQKIDDRTFRLILWYDNEMGYVHQLMELARKMTINFE